MTLQVLQQRQQALPAQTLAPGDRSARVVHAKAHGGINVLLAGDPFLHGIQRFVGNHRHRPPDQQAGIIGDLHHPVTLLLQVADGFLRRGMRVACRRGYHRHIAFNAVDHHHRAVEPQRQCLSGLPLRFNQIHLINFGDTVTSFFNAHRAVAVVHGCHPLHLGFVSLPVVDALPALFAQPPCQHQLLLDQRRQKTTLLPEGVKYRAGHRKVHVLTNHVRQLQRTHRETAAFAQGRINHLRWGDLLFQRAPGFGIKRTRDAIDDEPRR